MNTFGEQASWSATRGDTGAVRDLRSQSASSPARRSRSANLSATMYLFISFGKSNLSQNRHLDILISDSKRTVDDFVGELPF